MSMRTYDIVGYTYEADYHCAPCTLARFPNGEGVDREGNDVHPMFREDVSEMAYEVRNIERETWTGVTCGSCHSQFAI